MDKKAIQGHFYPPVNASQDLDMTDIPSPAGYLSHLKQGEMIHHSNQTNV